jgi:hypothetical protein
MGRTRRAGNHTPQKKKKKKTIKLRIQWENEENGYPVPDPNKTMINVTKEPSDTYKKILQRRNFGRNHRETDGEDTRHG